MCINLVCLPCATIAVTALIELRMCCVSVLPQWSGDHHKYCHVILCSKALLRRGFKMGHLEVPKKIKRLRKFSSHFKSAAE